MQFFTAKINTTGVYHYDSTGTYIDAAVGTIVTICKPEESEGSYFILDYANASLFTTFIGNLQFDVIDTFTDKPLTEVKEVTKEVPVETFKIVSLREVIGQDINEITFN